jgi:hypothetical protein
MARSFYVVNLHIYTESKNNRLKVATHITEKVAFCTASDCPTFDYARLAFWKKTLDSI